MDRPPSTDGDHSAATSPIIVLVCTDDIARSVARHGFLEGRLASPEPSRPRPTVVREPAAPLPVVVQRLTGIQPPPDLSVPAGLEPWLESSFTTRIAESAAALLVVSVAADVLGGVWRHRRHGFVVAPPETAMAPTPEQRRWLEQEFAPELPPSPADIEAALRTLAKHTEEMGAHLLVFNVSTFTPDEKVYDLAGFAGEPLALRAQRIDLLLDTVAGELGFSLVDVDRIVAELGAGEHVRRPAIYSDAACAACAEEAAGAIVDVPTLRQFFGTDVMRLVVPRYDKRTIAGRLVRWHRTAPGLVQRGDPLFDVRFDDLSHALDARQNSGGKRRSLLVSVLAAGDGHLTDIVCQEGDEVEVGATVAVVGTSPGAKTDDLASTASFPVGVKVATR